MKRRDFIQSTVLGSSLVITSNVNAENVENRKGYEVINAGTGGNNTIDLLERIDRDCLAHKPELVILKAGTNDMNSRKYVPVQEYEQNMRKIIEKIRGVGSRVLLMNLLPVYEPYLMTRHDPAFYAPEGHTGRKIKMNEAIKELSVEYNLAFLDLHHIFEKVGNIGTEESSLLKNEANSQTKDGLHPTPEGYRLIGVSVYHSIMAYKLPGRKIVCFGDSITRGDGKPDGANYPSYLKKLLT